MMPAPYREFAERWGSPEFSAYVEVLRRQADEAMATIDQVGALRAPEALGAVTDRS